MRYTVYKTTHLASRTFYTGAHRPLNPTDGYLGSGKLIGRAIKKYGRVAFTKEVLFEFDTPEEMYAKEREIVTTKFKRDPANYNLVEGGEGGWDGVSEALTPEQRKEVSAKGLARRRELYRTDPEWVELRRKQQRAAQRQRWMGETHTEETKAKMRGPRAATAGRHNSQYGTAWVCREGEAPRKIPKTELPAFTEAGWQRGRKVQP